MSLPQNLVLVDPSFIDLLIIFIGALFIVLILVLAGVGFESHRTPKEAKETKRSKVKKLPLILAAGLSHFADLFSMQEFMPEGVLETKPIGRKGEKHSLRFVTPRKIKAELLEVAEGKDAELTTALLQRFYDLNTEKVFLRHTGVPIMVAVRDKTIAAGIKGLGALSFIAKLEKLEKLDKQIAALENTDNFKDLGGLLKEFRSKISVIDFDAIRTNVPDGWDQTIGEAMKEYDRTVGEREKARQGNDLFKMILIAGVIVAVMIIAAGVVAAILGGA